MFEKLLSVLPYNPSLIHQMRFYGGRMREEAGIRRIGLIFMVLTFFVQFFAVLSPPKYTAADSTNSLIAGGFSTPAEAKAICLNNTRHYGDILHNYNITCESLGSAESLTIHSSGQNYYSMGWVRQGFPSEVPVNVPSAGILYFRKLADWGSASYKALRVRDDSGKVYYILYDCGNLTSVGLPGAHEELTPVHGASEVLTPTPVVSHPTPTPTPKPTPKAVCTLNPNLPPGTPATSPLCYTPCQYNPLIPATDSRCKPCDKSISSQDTLACIVVHKTATNITAGIADANNTTANAGDVITYTLYAQNTGKAIVKQFVFQENLSDVLDYADATDLHGGTMDSYQIVSWPARDIASGQTATVQITVKVKNPLPQTAVDPADPAHFDMIMTNIYGNTINIKLPGSPAKTVETAAATLPNTGPGAGLFVAASIVIIAGYFYGRSRLLARESNLAVQEMASA